MKKYSLLIFILIILGGFIFYNKLNPIVKEVEKISIQDGNTGEIIQIENSNTLLEDLRNINYKLKGISLWRMGYTYKIKFENKGKKTYMIINSNNNIKKEIINYSSSEDIINILEKFIKEEKMR